MRANTISSYSLKIIINSLLLIFILNFMHSNVIGNSHDYAVKENLTYDLKLTGTTLFDYTNINNNIITNDIIGFLSNQDVLNDLNLSQNENGDYLGIVLLVSSNGINMLPKGFKLRGFITIFDREGNYAPQKHEMLWLEAQKALLYVWSAKDKFGNYVSPGIYNCVAEIEEITPELYPNGGGPKQTKKLLVGVKGAGSDCGSCGTSAELAFIPPIGFKLASMAGRRKKWWQKLLERFKLKKKTN